MFSSEITIGCENDAKHTCDTRCKCSADIKTGKDHELIITSILVDRKLPHRA